MRVPLRHPIPWVAGRRGVVTSAGGAARARGQSLVEFSLVLVPLFMLVLGIIQFGLIFNSYVTLTNAAREGARTGTIYVYNRTLTKAQNDAARNAAIRDSVMSSMNLLSTTGPNFSSGTTWTQTATTYANGDIVVTYALPAGIVESDTRTGQKLTVRLTYHQDLMIPMISSLLPQDSGGRLALPGEVTMVIN